MEKINFSIDEYNKEIDELIISDEIVFELILKSEILDYLSSKNIENIDWKMIYIYYIVDYVFKKYVNIGCSMFLLSYSDDYINFRIITTKFDYSITILKLDYKNQLKLNYAKSTIKTLKCLLSAKDYVEYKIAKNVYNQYCKKFKSYNILNKLPNLCLRFAYEFY